MNKIRLLAPIFLLLLSAQNAVADKAWRSLSSGIVQADAIVVARVARVIAPPSGGEYVTEIEIGSVLKGALKERRLTLRLPGRTGLDAEARYILFLTRNSETPSGFDLVSNMTKPHEERVAEEIAAMAKLMPPWSRPEGGVSIIAIPDKFSYKLGENIDLSVGYKNTGAGPAVLRYRDWPLDTHSNWSIDIQPRGGTTLAAQPHPHLTADQITEHFSAHGNSFDLSLRQGETHFLSLDRINSAAQGWGHKERLDFKYYPITKPGRYTIRVTSHHLYGDKPLTTEAFTITVE